MAQIQLHPEHNEKAANSLHRYLRRMPQKKIQDVQNAFDETIKAYKGRGHTLDHDNLIVDVTGTHQPSISNSIPLRRDKETGNFHGQIIVPHGNKYAGLSHNEYQDQLRKNSRDILADFLLAQGEHQHKLFKLTDMERNIARQSLSNYLHRIQTIPNYTPDAHIEQLGKEFGGQLPEKVKNILIPIFDRE